MKKKVFLLLFALFFACSSAAIASTINLNDFYPNSPFITLASDGSSALLMEDPDLGSVFLSNDPVLGDPLLPFPSTPFTLTFDYEFTVGLRNLDNFYVKLFDADSGINIIDFSTEYDNSIGNSLWVETGTISWNVAGAPTTGLGLEFQLNAYDVAADSFVSVSNVKFEANSNPIPEPATFMLLGFGLIGIAGLGRKKLQA